MVDKEEAAEMLSFPFRSPVAAWSTKKATALLAGRQDDGFGRRIIDAGTVASYIYDVQRTWLKANSADGSAVIDLSNLVIRGDISLITTEGKFPFLNVSNTIFQDVASFAGAEFENTVVFEKVEFMKLCSFARTKFKAAASFNNSTFHYSTDFSEACFSAAPTFHEAKLHEDTSFRSTTFTRTKTHRDYSAYRRLRELMHDSKEAIQEGEFFVYEQRTLRHMQFMESRKKRRLSLEGSVSWVYDKICRYGQSIGRPLFLLIALNVAFATTFWLTDAATIAQNSTAGMKGFSPGIGLTLQNILNPFALFGKALPFEHTAPWVVLASITQSLFSLTLFALVLFAVRRRFRKGSE